MIVYQDRSFCNRKCNNKNCKINVLTIPKENKLPVSIRGGFDDCKDYIEPFEEEE